MDLKYCYQRPVLVLGTGERGEGKYLDGLDLQLERRVLPSKIRTGPRPTQDFPAPTPINTSVPKSKEPTIYSPQPVTSTLLAALVTDYPVRSHTPELVPESMSSRFAAY